MERLSRYGRRMRITLIKTMTVACFVCIIAIPFLSKKLLKTEANYYSITINGIKVGAANTEEEVIVALASARQELSAQYEEIVYMDPDIEIAKENKTVAQRMSVACAVYLLFKGVELFAFLAAQKPNGHMFVPIGENCIPLDRIGAGSVWTGASVLGRKIALIHDVQAVNLGQRQGHAGALHPAEHQRLRRLLHKAGRILGKAGQAHIVHEPDALRQQCLFLSEHVKTSYADLTQKLRWWMYSSSGAPSMLSASLRTIYCIQVLRPCNLTFPKYALGLLTERAPLAMRLMVNATLLCP